MNRKSFISFFFALKSVTINTIIEILKKEDALGFITTEYIKEER